MISIFVNERRVSVPAAVSVVDAVATVDADAAAALSAGRAFVTDGVGRSLDLGAPVSAGTILRVIRSHRRSQAADACS